MIMNKIAKSPSHQEIIFKMVPPIIVIGGGLAGLSTSLSLYQNMFASNLATAVSELPRILLVDKQPRLGGNSMKATSGMNAAETQHQRLLNIEDSKTLFIGDTVQSGHGMCDQQLVSVLASHSTRVLEWLEDQSGLKLDSVIKCGGHSVARTHRESPRSDGRPVAIGYDLVSSLIKRVQEHPEHIQVHTLTRLVKLNVNEGRVIGVEVVNEQTGEEKCLDASAVVLTSGGYGFDVARLVPNISDSPQLRNLADAYSDYNKRYALSVPIPTTNGPWSTGDGQLLAGEAGVNLIHLHQVQVHPTSFVDPSNPVSGTHILAPEALRGCGGVLISPVSKTRFVDELKRRDEVTEAIVQHCRVLESNTPPVFAFLVMSEESVQKFGEPSIKFYASKQLFVSFDSLSDAAQHMGMSGASQLLDQLPPEKFSHRVDKQTIYVAMITPAVHYTMGGCAMSNRGELLSTNLLRWRPKVTSMGSNDPLSWQTQYAPLKGLYGAGEVTGGVHGGNRLAGNSLLECGVFGKIIGETMPRSLPLSSLAFQQPQEARCEVVLMMDLGEEWKLLRMSDGGVLGKNLSLQFGQGIQVSADGGEHWESFFPVQSPELNRNVFDILVDSTSRLFTNEFVPLRDQVLVRGPVGMMMDAPKQDTDVVELNLKARDIGCVLPLIRDGKKVRVHISDNRSLPFKWDPKLGLAVNPI